MSRCQAENPLSALCKNPSPALLFEGCKIRRPYGQNDIGGKPHQLHRVFAHALDVTTGPAPLDRDAVPLAPAELRERLPECRDPRLYDRVTLACGHQSADPPHWTGLLRTRGQWADECRSTEKRNELAALQLTNSGVRSQGDSITDWREIVGAYAVRDLRSALRELRVSLGRRG